MIELAIVVGVIAIIAAVALPNIDFSRFRADGNARNVQNKLIMAQVRAVSKNMNIVLAFDWTLNQFTVLDDQDGNGTYTPGETINRFALDEGFRFMQPPTTIDGATPFYATGPGIVSSLAGGSSVSDPHLLSERVDQWRVRDLPRHVGRAEDRFPGRPGLRRDEQGLLLAHAVRWDLEEVGHVANARRVPRCDGARRVIPCARPM